jgi:hypothetical protein
MLGWPQTPMSSTLILFTLCPEMLCTSSVANRICGVQLTSAICLPNSVVTPQKRLDQQIPAPAQQSCFSSANLLLWRSLAIRHCF